MRRALERTREAYKVIRSVPAPKRGEILRQIREALAAKVRMLARLRSQADPGYMRMMSSEMTWEHWCPSKWARFGRRAKVRCFPVLRGEERGLGLALLVPQLLDHIVSSLKRIQVLIYPIIFGILFFLL